MTIEQIREQIDQIDTDIQNLLDKRVSLCQIAKNLKLKENKSLFDYQREQKLLSAIHPQYKSVFTQIISLCRYQQFQLKVYCEKSEDFLISYRYLGNFVELELKNISEYMLEKGEALLRKTSPQMYCLFYRNPNGDLDIFELD